MPEPLQELNESLFFTINNGLQNPVNDYLIGYSTFLGDGKFLFPILVISLFLFRRTEFLKYLLLAVSTFAIAGIVLNLMKAMFGMPRPLTFFKESIEIGQVAINVMFEPLYYHSFPSGHSQTAFTAAHFISKVFLRSGEGEQMFLWKGLPYLVAIVVGISRIYVGAHFPIDVFIGALLGWGISSGLWWFYVKMKLVSKI
ncbi:MAG: phosphatase PAP2 family protein [Chloroherpetonaceae bacterium]|nr:phosphatase PAP2 family protein [Chloroherpetonaceae bacterium]